MALDGRGVVGRRLSGSAIARRSSCWRAQVPTYVQASPTRPEQPSLHSGSLASTVGGGILAAGTAFAVPRASSGERPTLVRGPSRPSDIFAPYPPFYLMDMSHILTSHNEPRWSDGPRPPSYRTVSDPAVYYWPHTYRSGTCALTMTCTEAPDRSPHGTSCSSVCNLCCHGETSTPESGESRVDEIQVPPAESPEPLQYGRGAPEGSHRCSQTSNEHVIQCTWTLPGFTRYDARP